jgi:ribonuclease HII
VIKGDGKYLNIAAASVLAKTYRDDFMKKLDLKHPQYQWKKNKGYPTSAHREGIQKYGITEYHRTSFQLLPKQLKFNF